MLKEEAFQIEKRRSGRIAQELSIQILGTDTKGKDFIVPTRTSLLSYHGAQILLSNELIPEQQISLYWPETQKEVEARVVERLAKEGQGYVYSIEFLDAQTNFWDIDFPTTNLGLIDSGLATPNHPREP